MTIQQQLDQTRANLSALMTRALKFIGATDTEATAAAASPEAFNSFIVQFDAKLAAAPKAKTQAEEDEEKKKKEECEKKAKAEEDKKKEECEKKAKASLDTALAALETKFDAKLAAALEVAASKKAVEIAAAAGIAPPAKADIAGQTPDSPAHGPKGLARLTAALSKN